MRVTPIGPEDWDENVVKAMSVMLSPDRLERRDPGTALATLARNPKLTRAFLRFNVYLLFGSTLPARVRELAVLRVAHRRGCDYEWIHHVEMGTEVGLSSASIEAVTRGEGLDEFDQAVITAVDELEEKSNMTDASWSILSQHLDEPQRMDFVFTVGCYGLLAMAFNTFGVLPEQEN
ncbi:carboxymuconolactone decarboxylase family protein [Mycolicibacterium sediminis]|uniref:Carboxymuconolactone decarboxylase n=1 Tax=Mycolicibacterium sediminis TaxID=1286180 RepID=A0A7I7QXC2_9MYCO|nr:carboxymuconolactone decarboxylase family protein [Mycolicibacterium sediminis]BBY30991.1 carboxymuconolactone decarboxylase [Mycolicibacterium sediminis]